MKDSQLISNIFSLKSQHLRDRSDARIKHLIEVLVTDLPSNETNPRKILHEYFTRINEYRMIIEHERADMKNLADVPPSNRKKYLTAKYLVDIRLDIAFEEQTGRAIPVALAELRRQMLSRVQETGIQDAEEWVQRMTRVVRKKMETRERERLGGASRPDEMQPTVQFVQNAAVDGHGDGSGENNSVVKDWVKDLHQRFGGRKQEGSGEGDALTSDVELSDTEAQDLSS